MRSPLITLALALLLSATVASSATTQDEPIQGGSTNGTSWCC